ncbi:hypothetical protein AWV81_07575 [Bacillus subtilis subsp. natto]|nr:hypothetical protein AWV81_07575 [Bacillus subtilis subsp. natto]API95256.1 hypothetical protein BKP58_04755 [Bacillus subtilis]RAM54587.1 hypothetical protein DI05_15060 [Bacillus subtilis]BEH05436.1 hypothetical protein BSNN_14690 [Bacillus subtilis subsp. natto]
MHLSKLGSPTEQEAHIFFLAIKKHRKICGVQLVEKTTFFLQAFLFYTVSLDIHQVSDAEKALPHA